MGNTVYVLIFAFDYLGRVLLTLKTHPKWQAGKWNGLGGEMEYDTDSAISFSGPEGETYVTPVLACAKREFQEEAGLDIQYGRFETGPAIFYPNGVELWIYWLDLEKKEEASERNDTGEENRWFTVDEINDLINGDFGTDKKDGTEFVPAAYELLQLVRSLRDSGLWGNS